jgi:peptide/nickel transport system substrate-binding protein
MNREPLALYIFRFVVALGLFVFMGMLYWSSLLVEQDLKRVHDELRQLKVDVRQTKGDAQAAKQLILKGGVCAVRDEPEPEQRGSGNDRPHMSAEFPNLLSEDPFYAETLPTLLPKGFLPYGTRKTSTIGRPDDLHPFTNWSAASGWVSQCGVSLARLKFGRYETLAPDMAIKIEERPRKDLDVPEFWVHLRDGVFWQPLSEKLFDGKIKLAPHFLEKHPVTAHDFKFWFDAMMNPHVQVPGAVALRNYLGEIEEIEVVDPLTFIVRWRPRETVDADGEKVLRLKYAVKQLTGGLNPLASFVYQYFPDGSKIVEDDSDPATYRTNSVWAQNFAQHWAKNVIPSCGAWIFEGMSDRQITFRRNPDHYFPYDVLVQRMEVTFRNSTDSVWQDFKLGAIDSHELIPDQLIELDNFLNSSLYLDQAKKGNSINQLRYLGRNYLYLGWNQARPFFKSKIVRQAMTLAINRSRIIAQNLNGMGMEITGPFAPNSSAYDRSIKPWPFDPQKARELLEEDGWYDSDGDGIIDKLVDGERIPFDFSLTYYVKNPTTKSIVEYAATALEDLGIRVRLNGVDLADLSAAVEEKSFDALCLGWGLGTPPEDPRQLWYSKGATEPGSSNTVGFANEEADSIIDALDFEDNPDKRVALYHRFHAIIHEEQPYTFVYTPKTLYLYRDYLQNVFIPSERQDLIPGADIAQPNGSVIWIKEMN